MGPAGTYPEAQPAQVSVVLPNHVLAQCGVSVKRVVGLRITYAAGCGCQLLKVCMQGLTGVRKDCVRNVEVVRPPTVVPHLVQDRGPFKPAACVRTCPAHDHNLQAM